MEVRNYSIEIYDNEERREKTYTGFVIGENTTELVKKILEYYIDDEHEFVSLNFEYNDISDSGIIEISGSEG